MTEREKVIAFILDQYKDENRFRVFDNTKTDKKIVAGQFPDIIFLQPEPPPNNNILFLFKIENGNALVDSVSEWKNLGSTSSVFYIVVRKDKLDEAKKLASATSVRAKFAWYEMGSDGNVMLITYE